MTHSTLPDLEKIEVSRKKLDDITKENFISNLIFTLANLKKNNSKIKIGWLCRVSTQQQQIMFIR